MKRPYLSVVIVSLNTAALLQQCLESLYHNAGQLSLEVFVVENGSYDGTLEMIEKDFPQVDVLKNQRNLSYARANNQALRLARGRYALLLNSDTVVLPRALEMMVDFLDHTTQAGIVGARLLYADGTVQGSAQSFPTPISYFFGRKSLLSRWFPHNRFTRRYLPCFHLTSEEPLEVAYVSGAALMVRRRVKLLVKPGIIGIAQVSGRGRITFQETLACDVKYLRNKSLKLDLQIILKTIKKTCQADGAY